MKPRTGKECKKYNCVNNIAYANWYSHLGSSALKECMNCKNAFVSQYKREAK